SPRRWRRRSVRCRRRGGRAAGRRATVRRFRGATLRSAVRAASRASLKAKGQRCSSRRRAATRRRSWPPRARPRAHRGCRARRRGSPASVRPFFESLGREVAELAAHRTPGGRGSLEVVLGAPKREVAVPRRPGGAPVAVQRHARAPRIDELGAAGTRAAKLKMAVAEDDRLVVDAREQALLALLRLRGEAL